MIKKDIGIEKEKKVKHKFSILYRSLLRRHLNTKNRKRLYPEARDISILSANCIGGVIYHELGLKMLSPTINLYIKPCDFVKLASSPREYLSKEVFEIQQQEFDFPVLGLGDILLFCNHASTFIEAKEAWDRRKERFNYEKYVIMMSERDGCTYQDLKAFDNISHKYKVVFVHKNMPEISCAVHLPGTEIIGGGWSIKLNL